MGCEKPEGCPFCLAWWPTSVSCAVRGPSSGWLLPLGLGPEPMNVNIPAQPTVDNQIQMVCAWGTGTQHLYFGWVQSDDRWVSIRRNALSLAITQQSQLLFLWSYFEPILNIFLHPALTWKKHFSPIFFTFSSPVLGKFHHFYSFTSCHIYSHFCQLNNHIIISLHPTIK